MNIAEKLVTIAGNQQKVFNAGGLAYSPKGNASGEVVTLTDISPIEHNLGIKVSSKNLVNVGKWSTRNCIKNGDNTVTCNIDNKEYAEIYSQTLISGILLANKGKTITFSIGKTLENKFISLVIYGKRADGTNIQVAPYKKNSNSISAVISEEFASISEIDLRFNWLSSSKHTDTTTVITNIQLEIGSAATSYTPYIDDISTVELTVEESGLVYTPNADGTVDDVKSIYPGTTLLTDTPGALIEVEYYQDGKKVKENLTDVILSSGGALNEV